MSPNPINRHTPDEELLAQARDFIHHTCRALDDAVACLQSEAGYSVSREGRLLILDAIQEAVWGQFKEAWEELCRRGVHVGVGCDRGEGIHLPVPRPVATNPATYAARKESL